MKAKLTTAESEIASLLTVIRVLNEDRAGTTSSKRRKELNSSSCANLDVESQPVDHNIRLNNRYSCLDTENEYKASMDRDGYAAHPRQNELDVIEVISNVSMGVFQQQGNSGNNNNTTPQQQYDPTTINSNNNRSNKTSTVKTVRENNDKRVTRNSPIIFIGDSIVKSINPRKISKRRVVKRTFPGKNAEEIKSEINSISIPNDISNDTVRECVKNIENLANCVEQRFPNSLYGLSSITARNDIDVSTKINEVNKELEKLCEKKGFKFIDIA